MRDKKVKLLRAEFGASSVVFVLYVFCRAFEGDGYFLKWDKDECLIAADELKESPAYISEVLQGCLARSLFDQRVYQMSGILTSAGIQRRYLRGCEKRDGIEIASEYWLLNVDDKNDVPAGIRAKLTFFTVSGGKNGVNSPGNPINSPGNPQSKVKESKVKKSKSIDVFSQYASGDERLLKALRDFEEMRKLTKKPMTEKAKSMLLNSLDNIAKDTEEKISVLDQSTLHNWQTVYPLKKAKTNFSNNGEGYSSSYNLEEYENQSIFDNQEESNA